MIILAKLQDHLQALLQHLILVDFEVLFLVDDRIVEVYLELLQLVLWIYFVEEVEMLFDLL